MINNLITNIKPIFFYKNKKDKFKKIIDIILILIVIGLIRLFLEVLFFLPVSEYFFLNFLNLS